MLKEETVKALRGIVGEEHVLTAPEDLVCYAYDATPFTYLPDAVVIPGDTAEVAEVLRLANWERIPVIPRGSGTNISGGTAPERGGIVLHMSRFDKILEIDEENLTATVEPGVILADFHKAVEARGLFYPPDPASLSVATLGGTVSEGAGGPRGLKYGTTKDYVLGLEVVLPTGEVLWTGNKTTKNVSGYDLTHLFVGSEGTLGVITKIILRLLPLPPAKRTLLAIYDDLDDAARTVSAIIAARIIPTTLELMDRATMEFIESYKPVGMPLDAEAVLLIEVDGDADQVDREADIVAEACRRHGAREVQVARDAEEAERLWAGRRTAYAAVARRYQTVIVEDATVPRNKLPQMVRRTRELAEKHGLTVTILAHAGDGNMHPLILTDIRDAEQMRRVEEFTADLFAAALEMGGALTGEHGIGLLKKEFLKWQYGEAGVALMRRIKAAFDPNHILNPGKVF